jgi:bacterioferritin (cytochrome b1)
VLVTTIRGASRTTYQPPFLARIQRRRRAPLAAPASHTEYKAGTSLAAMIREDLVAERIAVATYHEIVTYFGQDDPTSRTMMEAIFRTR